MCHASLKMALLLHKEGLVKTTVPITVLILKANEEVLKAKKKLFYRKYRHDLYENIGMVNENGEKWKMLRKHLSPPLTNRKTAQHYALNMNEIADELIDILSTNKRRLEQDTEGESCFF